MSPRTSLPDKVLAQYDLGQIHAVQPKTGGWIGDSFVVTSESGWSFFKRRAPGCSPERVNDDHALIQYLVSHAFPTPAVVPTHSGDTWIEWEGRIYEAYVYVKGRNYTPGDLRQIASLGNRVAQYHQLVSRYRPPRQKLPPWGDTSVVAFLDISAYVAPRLEALSLDGRMGWQEVKFVHDAMGQLKVQARRYEEESEIVSLTVHGALEPGNVLFDEEGGVVAWVDWADSAQFVRAFDVAHALLKFAGRRPDAVLPGQVGSSLLWPVVESFATAYRQGVRLTKVEGALLPWLMLACRIIDALWIDRARPQDHRRELNLAQELWDWLMQNATAIRCIFCGGKF